MLPIADSDEVLNHLDKLDRLDHASAWMSGGELVGLVLGALAIVLVFATPIIIVVASLRARTRRQNLLNEVVLKLADKGQPIPPELFAEVTRPRSDQRRAILWAAVGAGVVLYGVFSGNSDALGGGFIPLMIGLGFYMAGRLEQKQRDADKT